MSTLFPVVIAAGFHLFPFRTEKLSPTAPMVLRKRESRSPPSYFQVEALPARLLGGLFVSFCRVNAALFCRGSGFVLYHANAALFPRAVALFRRVGGALHFTVTSSCSLYVRHERYLMGGLIPSSNILLTSRNFLLTSRKNLLKGAIFSVFCLSLPR